MINPLLRAKEEYDGWSLTPAMMNKRGWVGSITAIYPPSQYFGASYELSLVPGARWTEAMLLPIPEQFDRIRDFDMEFIDNTIIGIMKGN